MERKVVSIQMKDQSKFHVDFLKRELQDSRNPENAIALSRALYSEKGYSFIYDPETRNIAGAPRPGTSQRRPYQVRVDNLTALQPETMSRLYGVPLSAVHGKTDEQFFTGLRSLREKQLVIAEKSGNTELFLKRLFGTPAELQVGNETYQYNSMENVLYAVDDAKVYIDLNKLDIDPHAEHYTCLYDLRYGFPIEKDPLGHYSPDVVWMFIPREERIDPVGVALQRGFEAHDLLYMNPIQKDLECFIQVLPKQDNKINQQKDHPKKGRSKGL
jgi:hypothetical protein